MTSEADAQNLQALPTPEDVQRGLHWSERWRDKFREGTWLRARYDAFFLPIDKPTAFTEPHEELVMLLAPRKTAGKWDEERTKEILEEAQSIFEHADQRGQAAERRATTLRGAVAIAASLILAGERFSLTHRRCREPAGEPPWPSGWWPSLSASWCLVPERWPLRRAFTSTTRRPRQTSFGAAVSR
ncbi:MAG: hypothetical protein ACRDLY_04395 [Thermoleophilaceae bacterium]